MITVDGRAVLVVRLDAGTEDAHVAATKSTLLRESTGRVLFVESGPADVHIALTGGTLRIDAAGIRDQVDLARSNDSIATIEQTVGLLARRLNQHLQPTAS